MSKLSLIFCFLSDEGDSNSRIRHPSTQSLPESSMPQTRNADGSEDDKVKDKSDEDGDQDGWV